MMVWGNCIVFFLSKHGAKNNFGHFASFREHFPMSIRIGLQVKICKLPLNIRIEARLGLASDN